MKKNLSPEEIVAVAQKNYDCWLNARELASQAGKRTKEEEEILETFEALMDCCVEGIFHVKTMKNLVDKARLAVLINLKSNEQYNAVYLDPGITTDTVFHGTIYPMLFSAMGYYFSPFPARILETYNEYAKAVTALFKKEYLLY